MVNRLLSHFHVHYILEEDKSTNKCLLTEIWYLPPLYELNVLSPQARKKQKLRNERQRSREASYDVRLAGEPAPHLDGREHRILVVRELQELLLRLQVRAGDGGVFREVCRWDRRAYHPNNRQTM